MSSSTSSSERTARAARFPAALVATIVVVVLIESIVASTSTRFMEAQPLIYETKMGALADELRGDVVVFGDSTAVAAVVPAAIDPAFAGHERVVNLALPGSGPVVAEFLLDTLLADDRITPPKVLVLAFSTLSSTEWRTNFVEYPLTHLLPLGAVVRAAWAQRDVGYLLEWIATRLPSLRYREEMKSGALSLVFDRSPEWAERYRAITGSDLYDEWFEWRYFDRAGRNARLQAELLDARGWRLFEEMRLPAGELDPQARFDTGALYFPPFEAAPREERALVRLLDRAAEHDIDVIVLPSAQPRAMDAALALDGGDERIARYEQRVYADRANVQVPMGLRLAWPHRYFGDLAHVNEAGVDHYTETILPVLRASLAPGR